MEENKIKEQVENQINTIIEEGVQVGNIDMLGKLVDIHKDLANEEYWKVKKEVMKMNYRNYGNYNEGYGNYGRRGVPGSGRGRGRRRYSEAGGGYQGEEMINEMYEGYQGYSAGKEEYGRGNYGAKEDTMKSLDYMLQSVTDFIEMLKHDASSQEEMQLIQKYTREISEM